jgi:hypothetical protein
MTAENAAALPLLWNDGDEWLCPCGVTGRGWHELWTHLLIDAHD